MGFNSFRNTPQVLPSPAQIYRDWKGSAGSLTFNVTKELEDGSKEYQTVETELPLTVAVLEVTNDLSKTTFKAGQGGKRVPDKSYFSTEKIEWDDPMILRQSEYVDGERKVTVVCKGSYDTIKANFDTSGMFRVILYVWNFATEQIERIQLKGSGRGAWFEWAQKLKKNKQSYFNAPVRISKNPEAKSSPMGNYYEPMFELGPEYSDEQVALLKEKDDEVVEYLKSLHAKNMADYNGYQSGEGNVDYSASQEPKQWEGEGSQERSKAYGNGSVASQEAPEDGQIDLSDIPF